jgi:hypothetical protein
MVTIVFGVPKNPFVTEPNVNFGPGFLLAAIAVRTWNRDRTGVVDAGRRRLLRWRGFGFVVGASFGCLASLAGFRFCLVVGASAPTGLWRCGVGLVAAASSSRRSDRSSALRRCGVVFGFVE